MGDIFIFKNPHVALTPYEVDIDGESNLKNFPTYLVTSNKLKQQLNLYIKTYNCMSQSVFVEKYFLNRFRVLTLK